MRKCEPIIRLINSQYLERLQKACATTYACGTIEAEVKPTRCRYRCHQMIGTMWRCSFQNSRCTVNMVAWAKTAWLWQRSRYFMGDSEDSKHDHAQESGSKFPEVSLSVLSGESVLLGNMYAL